MDSPEVNDGSDVWKNQHTWNIQSWKLYSYSGVHVLETVGGLVVHMFVDKKYPLSVNLIERMLDHQLEICQETVGNELTTAVQLIAFLKKQIADSRRPKLVVNGFCFLENLGFWYTLLGLGYPKLDGFHLPYSWNEKWLVQESTALDADCLVADSKFMKVAFGVDFKILLFNPLVYVVPTGRVKVPAGRYVVPTGKDNVIVSAGRTKVIPAAVALTLEETLDAPYGMLVKPGFPPGISTRVSSHFSKNDVLYFNVIPRDGIYEIDMHNLVLNVNSIYNVSNKRAKHNLDSTYLWHYHLAHISKKCIEKLQQEGLLKSIDDESFDQCVSCLSGKMTRKPFPDHTERETYRFGIIHTDVCCPLRHVSRQGASYFITFTDDYTHYGYVYLLKHKHEVFETFKVFKNKVENQLEKTIKALQSDQGGEYISQEFKDYLKAWSATHILNMVPTKRFDKTPYELWYGKVLNLSYLKDTQRKQLVTIFTSHLKTKFLLQDKDTSPSEITIQIPMEVEGFEPPQEEVILIRRSERTHRALNRLCLNLEAKEHSLGDVNEPTSYKAAMLDLKSNKWLDAMNARMQSMIDNKASGSNVTFLILYVDDIIIMGNHIPSLQNVKDYLGKCFVMKDLGEVAFILGIKIYIDRSKRLIGLSQSAYIDKILKRYKMDNSKHGHIPMQERLDLNKIQGASTPEEVKHMQNEPYALAKCTLNFELIATAMLDLRLKETISKVEYIAASEAAMEVVWIRKFISGLGIVPTINEPIKMFCDNHAALLIANEPGVQRGARHYHRRYHYVCECIELGEINLLKVHTDDNLDDPFTKALP
ncbi:retrotransposon protein, putative, ty1-copia subclass [Tanacetum coccineum]|uniref:Retrotransposon protein, putative, ty1-copia subclass n=1 Tax=Tanacetum coccineum TaxID=301880 RepID=A0ABQ5B8K8_9ASTR